MADAEPTVEPGSDPTQQATVALAQVEDELAALRERRRQLDATEGSLWVRRNRLERQLIEALGTDWWHQHRNGSGNGNGTQPADDRP